ncbi:MAG: hypothetical protein WBD78_12410 [Methylocella sp.]
MQYTSISTAVQGTLDWPVQLGQGPSSTSRCSAIQEFCTRGRVATVSLQILLKALHKLYASLQLEILNLLEMLNQLHESPEHELLTLSQKKPQLIEEVAAQQRKAMSDEIAALNEEAARLQREIDELSAAGDGAIAGEAGDVCEIELDELVVGTKERRRSR